MTHSSASVASDTSERRNLGGKPISAASIRENVIIETALLAESLERDIADLYAETRKDMNAAWRVCRERFEQRLEILVDRALERARDIPVRAEAA